MSAISQVLVEAVKHALEEIGPAEPAGIARPVGPLFLSPKEAAEYLGMGETTLRERRKAGLLKPVSEQGRIVYRRIDLESYARKLQQVD